MKKAFKTGEKVRLKGDSTIMNVLKYAEIDGTESNYCVECWWRDEKWGYLTAMFHQNMLIKCRQKNIHDLIAEKESKRILQKSMSKWSTLKPHKIAS